MGTAEDQTTTTTTPQAVTQHGDGASKTPGKHAQSEAASLRTAAPNVPSSRSRQPKPARYKRNLRAHVAVVVCALFLDYLTITTMPVVPNNIGFSSMVLPCQGVDGVTVFLQGITVLPHMNEFVATFAIENNSGTDFDNVVLTLGYDASIVDPGSSATHATFKVRVGSLAQSAKDRVSVILPLGYGNRAAPDSIDFILSSDWSTLTAGPLMAKDIVKSFFSRHEVIVGMLSGQGQGKSSEINAMCSYFNDQPFVKTVAQTGFLAESTTFSFDPYVVYGKLYAVDTPGVTESFGMYTDIDDAMRRLATGDYAPSYRTDEPHPDDGGATFSKILDVLLLPFMPAVIGMDKSDGAYAMVESTGHLAKGVAELASSKQPAGRQTIIKPFVVLDEATAEEEVAVSYRSQLATDLSVNLSAVGSARTYHGDSNRRDVQVDLSTHRLLVSIVRELHGGFDVEPATAYDVVHDELLRFALLIPSGAFTTLAAALLAVIAYTRME